MANASALKLGMSVAPIVDDDAIVAIAMIKVTGPAKTQRSHVGNRGPDS